MKTALAFGTKTRRTMANGWKVGGLTRRYFNVGTASDGCGHPANQASSLSLSARDGAANTSPASRRISSSKARCLRLACATGCHLPVRVWHRSPALAPHSGHSKSMAFMLLVYEHAHISLHILSSGMSNWDEGISGDPVLNDCLSAMPVALADRTRPPKARQYAHQQPMTDFAPANSRTINART